MKYINSDNDFDYYTDIFEGIEVRMQKNRKTQELYFNTESVALILGFKNADEMLQSNQEITNGFLDGMNNETVISTSNL